MQIRTEVGAPVQGRNGKWSSCFNTFAGEPGKEILANIVTSPALWESEDDAYAASNRALTVLEETGMFPNMCERW